MVLRFKNPDVGRKYAPDFSRFPTSGRRLHRPNSCGGKPIPLRDVSNGFACPRVAFRKAMYIAQTAIPGRTKVKSNRIPGTRAASPASDRVLTFPRRQQRPEHGVLHIVVSHSNPRMWSVSHPKIRDMAVTIRPATRADVPRILAFIQALAAYEREPDAVIATEEGLLRDGFGPNPYFHCLMAEFDGSPVGFALYFFNYSTWLGRPGIYLEDLFVLPEFRGLGIGRNLLQQVAAIALEKDCLRLQWEVLDWNTTAIDFYRAMGAEFLDEWRNVRVSGEALRRLAIGVASPDAAGTTP